jgi:hypothetical protein
MLIWAIKNNKRLKPQNLKSFFYFQEIN